MNRLVVSLLFAACIPLVGAPPAGAEPCAGSSGVTVVVDFASLGNGVQIGCAAGDPSSGFGALQAAGFGYSFVPNRPGFICRISERPDPCNGAPATAYWSYWTAPPGGSWTYSNVGAGARDPAPGNVEGWAFGSGAAPSMSPPAPTSSPAQPPPGPDPGQPPPPPVDEPAPVPPAAQETPDAAAPEAGTKLETPSSSTSDQAPLSAAGPVGERSPFHRRDAVGSATAATTTTIPAPGGEGLPVTSEPPAPDPGFGVGTTSVTSAEGRPRDLALASGREGDNGGGGAPGAIAGVALVAAVAGGAFVAHRRRRASTGSTGAAG